MDYVLFICLGVIIGIVIDAIYLYYRDFRKVYNAGFEAGARLAIINQQLKDAAAKSTTR